MEKITFLGNFVLLTPRAGMVNEQTSAKAEPRGWFLHHKPKPCLPAKPPCWSQPYPADPSKVPSPQQPPRACMGP